MAHDISFTDSSNGQTFGFFFGYAGGIFYTAFDAHHLDAGISGANGGVTRSADEVRRAIEIIKTSPVYTSYPDPERLHDIVEKLEAFLKQKPNGYAFIHFS
ncbi:MAG: hypothetical protein L6R45_10420 [Anaerolineae bacterium]|nr:hypothetical protein [Anaerolineae bacterium]